MFYFLKKCIKLKWLSSILGVVLVKGGSVMEFSTKSLNKDIHVILKELLEALALQELSMAHLIDSQSKLLQAMTKKSMIKEGNNKIKIEFDTKMNELFCSLADYEKWILKKIITIRELKEHFLLMDKTNQLTKQDAEDYFLDDKEIERFIDELGKENDDDTSPSQ